MTDQAEYTAVPLGPPGPYREWEFTLVATLTNPSSRTLYVERCEPTSTAPVFAVVSVPETADESAYSRAWACAGHDRPIVVAPRSSRMDHLTIRGPASWTNGEGRPLGALNGRVQLVYVASGCRGFNPCGITPVKPTSNEFVVSAIE